MCFMRKELQIVYLSNTLREKGLYLEFFRYPVSLRIQYECGKIRTRKTPNTGTFHAVILQKKSNGTTCSTTRMLMFWQRNTGNPQRIFRQERSWVKNLSILYGKYSFITTAWKVCVFGVILVRIFMYSDWIWTYLSVFSPNTWNTDLSNSEYAHCLRSVLHW